MVIIMENSKTREPQQKRSIEKKKKIIETGFLLMCDNGYQKTTTADIAKAAGVSTGIVYSYFKDKHDIFVEGLNLYKEKILSPIYNEFIVPFTPRKSIEKIIDSLIEAHKVFYNAHREIEALVMTDDEVAAIMIDTEQQITEQLEKFLTEVGYDSSNLAEKTHIIYNMVESFCHEITFHKHTGLNLECMRTIVIDTIINMLGTLLDTGTVPIVIPLYPY